MIQRLALILAVLVISLGVAGTYFIVLDEGRLKDRLVSSVAGTGVGRELHIRGGLRFRWNRGLILELQDVHFVSPLGNSVVQRLDADVLAARVGVMSLAFGSLDLREVNVGQARMSFEISEESSNGLLQGAPSRDVSPAFGPLGDIARPTTLRFDGIGVSWPVGGDGAVAEFAVDELVLIGANGGGDIPFLIDGLALQPEGLGPVRVEGVLRRETEIEWLLTEFNLVAATADEVYQFSVHGAARLTPLAGTVSTEGLSLVINGHEFEFRGDLVAAENWALRGVVGADRLAVDALALFNHLALLGRQPAMSRLASMDLEIEFAALGLGEQDLVVDDVTGRLVSDDGRVLIRDLVGVFPGGWFAGDLDWDPSVSAWTGRLSAELSDAETLLRAAGENWPLSGAGSMSLSLEASPFPGRGVAASWTATGSLQLFDGRWAALHALGGDGAFDTFLGQLAVGNAGWTFSELELGGQFGVLVGAAHLPFTVSGEAHQGWLELQGESPKQIWILQGPAGEPTLHGERLGDDH